MSIRALTLAFLAALAVTGSTLAEADDLARKFADPPVSARPGAFWCWLNGNISKKQITSDLEQIKAKGMGGAEIWDVQALRNAGNFVPAGPAFMGEQSVDAIAHAIDEGTRLKLRLGLIASSGWNAGGSWVPPKYAGKGLFWSRDKCEGPRRIEKTLAFPKCDRAPKGDDGLPVHYREIAVLAFPKAATIAGIDSVVDISRHMDKAGKLTWQAPAGTWTVVRFICTNHGQHLIVPSPNSNGPMIDFIDPAATRFHLKHMMGKILARLGRKDFRQTALKFMEFDSMELARGVLWSDSFADRFAELRGYSPIRYLPILAGWKMADDDLNQRFQYDYKQAVSDQLIFSHYVTGSKTLGEYGLYLVAEAGGPGPPIWNSCPVDAIKALGAVDVPRGEFWVQNRNMFLIKEIASAAHVYGKKLVDAESFTTWRRWIDGPATYKRLADRALCEGLNHFTFHTFASSPADAGLPGRAYHAGMDINATATWWPKAKPFMDYLSRCGYMLRQGLFVGDVCYYYGDQAPNFFPAYHNVPRKIVPEELGLGYDFDVCDAQSILMRMRVEDGRVVLPDGMSYAILALPEKDSMPLAVLRKIEKLLAAGATVVGPRPVRSVGLKDSQTDDRAVKALGEKLWGVRYGKGSGENPCGKGRVVWGRSWRDVLAGQGIAPDFLVIGQAERDNIDYIHRRTADRDIYFVRNKTTSVKTIDCVFRVQKRKVQLWDPVSGRARQCDGFETVKGGTKVNLSLPPSGSIFVVFGRGAAGPEAPGGEVKPQADKTDSPPAIAIRGPWKLSFPKGWGAPESVVFDKLKSWTDASQPGVKYFSGTGTYENTFSIDTSRASGPGGLWLDLGDVKEVAEVYVNGRSVGVVWTPPYRVDISSAVKPGENRLKVEVINLWANRIIGDKTLADGVKYTKTNMSGVFKAGQTPLPSGLLGPVRIVGE